MMAEAVLCRQCCRHMVEAVLYRQCCKNDGRGCAVKAVL